MPQDPFPLASVVIPAYNAGGFLADCLDSVARQPAPGGMEVVVVDDGSTDDTPQRLACRPDVHYLRQTNQGPAAARNAGIHLSRGTYVAFLDADDLWPPGKLAQQIQLLDRHPEAALCFGDCAQFEDGADPGPSLFQQAGLGTSAWGPGPLLPDAYRRLLAANFVTTGSVVVRRAVLDQEGAFDEGLGLVEDLELWLRIARRYPILWTPELCLLRRRHANNLSRDRDAMSLAYLKVLERQRVDSLGDLEAPSIDFDALAAGEYGELADRALLDGRGRDAMGWARQRLACRSSLAAGWQWFQGAWQCLTRSRGAP